MFRRLLTFLRSEEIKNSGNLARDLLASENTFLAWTRTGLGFIAFGVSLEKVDALSGVSPKALHLQTSPTKLAAGMLVTSGSLCIAHGAQRYFSCMRQLQRGMFVPNVAGVTLMAATSIGIAFAGTLLILENDGGNVKSKAQSSENA